MYACYARNKSACFVALSNEEQGIVIFHIWRSLPYKRRLSLALFVIVLGFALQYLTFEAGETLLIAAGAGLILTGNLFLLVKGYSNKIDLGTYSPDSEWVKVDDKKLDEILAINKNAKRWDISGLDVTNCLGVLMFLGFLAALLILGFSSIIPSPVVRMILVFDAMALFIPHWFTGIKKIVVTPSLVSKINFYREVLDSCNGAPEKSYIDYLVYFDSRTGRLPRDVKMKMGLHGQPEDFLGMYVQISLNSVNNVNYEYFYVVLVAKAESQLLEKNLEAVQLPPNTIKEYKQENDIEILVIRQKTTKTSGYHTNTANAAKILKAGMENLLKVTGKKLEE